MNEKQFAAHDLSVPEQTQVQVNLGDRSYSIHIGEGLLDAVGPLTKSLGLGSRVLLVSNPTVFRLYGRQVAESLEKTGHKVRTVEIPDGEVYKSLSSAQVLYDAAFEHGLDRLSPVIALGGGVTGDLAGFAAATFLRGVPFIQVPTTLLAQVDSSVGGKVAVNHPRGKNIIGAFYQPRLVIADIKTLRTLPEREFNAGMAEVIKYGIIWDPVFFAFLENEFAALNDRKTEQLIRLVETSCRIKARVVEEDETEQGMRAILNFGHTFGHALESLTGYQKYVHGEAVASGMVLAAEAAVSLGLLSGSAKDRIEALVRHFSLPTGIGDLDPEDIIAHMRHDKKVLDGQVRFVLPESIGRVTIKGDVPEETLRAVLK